MKNNRGFNLVRELRIKPMQAKVIEGERVMRFMVHSFHETFASSIESHTYREFDSKQFNQFIRLLSIVQKINGLKRYYIKSATKGNYMLFTNKEANNAND